MLAIAFSGGDHTKKDKRKYKRLKKKHLIYRNQSYVHKRIGVGQKLNELFKSLISVLIIPFRQKRYKYVSTSRKKESLFVRIRKDFNRRRSLKENQTTTPSRYKKPKIKLTEMVKYRGETSSQYFKKIQEKEAKRRAKRRRTEMITSVNGFTKLLVSLLRLPVIIYYGITGKRGYSMGLVKMKARAAFSKYAEERRYTRDGKKREMSFFKKIVMMLALGNRNMASALRRKRKSWKESYDEWVENTKKVAKNEEQRRKFINTAITSTIVYIISFLFIYLIFQLATVMVALHYNIPTTLFFHGIRWPGPDSPLWNFDSVITTFMAGPVISLIIGVMLMALFYVFIVKDGFAFLKLFFVWSYIHAFNMFFGAFIVGVITEKGFGYAQEWLYLTTTDKYIISTISIFVLALIGFFSTSHFLQCSLSYYIIRRENRILFIASQVFIPWLVGSFLILFIKIPKNTFQEAVIFGPLVFAFIPIFPNYFSFWTARIKLPLKRKEPHVERIHVIALTIIFIIYRVVLNFGIRFS